MFKPGMNAILGATGSGKTSYVYFIEYAELNLEAI